MPSLAEKLGILPGKSVALVQAPRQTEALEEAVHEAGASLGRRLRRNRYDLIFFWPRQLSGLREELARLARRIEPDGAVWVIIPKKAFAAERGIDFSWEAMQAEALKTDLVDNKVAALTDEEYATRFVLRRAKRPPH